MKLKLLALGLLFTQLISAQCSRTGTLAGIDQPTMYPVSGTTNFTVKSDGTREVTFESDFATVQGLNLQVYLTTTERLGQGGNELLISTQQLQDDNGGTDMGDAITGSKTFSVANTVDLTDYTYVIIQCINADVLWGRAELSTTQSGAGCSALSVEDNFLAKATTMYPNPAKESFIIDNTSETPLNITIFNTSGKKVVSLKNSKEKNLPISLSGLNAGLYLVEIKNDNQRTFKKLIKN